MCHVSVVVAIVAQISGSDEMFEVVRVMVQVFFQPMRSCSRPMKASLNVIF